MGEVGKLLRLAKEYADIDTPYGEVIAVKQIDIESLHPYENHPFSLYDDIRFDDLVQSIRENGIIQPIIIRVREDLSLFDEYYYEILAGHNRVNAAKEVGYTTVPCIIKKGLSEEEAYAIVVESNLVQRSFKDLKLSEQGLILSRLYNTIQDIRGNTRGLSAEKLLKIKREIKFLYGEEVEEDDIPQLNNKVSTREILAQEYELNETRIARLIRLVELIPELQKLVDSFKLSLIAAVDISFIDKKDQEKIYKYITEHNVTITQGIGKKLRACNKYDIESIEGCFGKKKVIKEKKPLSVNIKRRTVSFDEKTFGEFFKDKKEEEIMELILNALKNM